MSSPEIPLPDHGAGTPHGALRPLLLRRHSCRDFTAAPVSLAELAGLAWAAVGTTAPGRRTCPSAHALHPVTLTVVSGEVTDLPAGVHRYVPERHALLPVAPGDHRERVAATTFVDRDWLRGAAALLVLSADLPAVDRHFADQPPYGERGRRYAWLEAGHAGQNVHLQATEYGIGTVLVGGFDDGRLRGLGPAVVPPGHSPLALLGLGRPAAPASPDGGDLPGRPR